VILVLLPVAWSPVFRLRRRRASSVASGWAAVYTAAVLEAILIGAGLTAVTTLIHGVVTAMIVFWIRALHVGHWIYRNQLTRSGFHAGLVLMLFLVSLLEAGIWAAVYLHVGMIDSFERAMYFSVVTYTTLGYGDVTLPEHWRLLGASQAAAGIIIFGWSTAIIVAAVQHVYFRRR
jgi:voltage-gated potassium channel Kch